MAFITSISSIHLTRKQGSSAQRSVFLQKPLIPIGRPLICRVRHRSKQVRMDLQGNSNKNASETERSAQTHDDKGSGPALSRYGIGALYIGFAASVLFLGPGTLSDPGQLGMIISGKLEDVNDVFFAVFNLFGATSITLAALLNAGASRQKKLRTDLFSVAGLFLGFWSFGPYLLGREYVPKIAREEVYDRGILSRALESKALAVATIGYALWAYAFALGFFTPGSLEYHDVLLYATVVDLFRDFSMDRGVFSTCIDFVILNTVIGGPLTEDMSRRGWFREGRNVDSILTALSFLLIPVLGPAVYLLLRPSLPESNSEKS